VGIGLSVRVAAGVDGAAAAVDRVVTDLLTTRQEV
jgi:hypothetical protein